MSPWSVWVKYVRSRRPANGAHRRPNDVPASYSPRIDLIAHPHHTRCNNPGIDTGAGPVTGTFDMDENHNPVKSIVVIGLADGVQATSEKIG